MNDYPIAIVWVTYSVARLRETGSIEYFAWPCAWEIAVPSYTLKAW